MTETLGANDFATRVSSDGQWDIVVFQAPTPERLDKIARDFQAFAQGPVEILERTPTSLLARYRNPPDGVLQAFATSGCSPILPNVYTAGHEDYQILAPTRGQLDQLVKMLEPHGKVELLHVAPVSVEELGVSVRVAELTRDMTPRQLGVLLEAVQEGYYESPRRTSTEELARRREVGRTTLEEHLRKAERHLLARLADVLSAYPFASRVARRAPGRPKKR